MGFGERRILQARRGRAGADSEVISSAAALCARVDAIDFVTSLFAPCFSQLMVALWLRSSPFSSDLSTTTKFYYIKAPPKEDANSDDEVCSVALTRGARSSVVAQDSCRRAQQLACTARHARRAAGGGRRAAQGSDSCMARRNDDGGLHCSDAQCLVVAALCALRRKRRSARSARKARRSAGDVEVTNPHWKAWGQRAGRRAGGTEGTRHHTHTNVRTRCCSQIAFGTYAGNLGTTMTYRVRKPGVYGAYKIVTEVCGPVALALHMRVGLLHSPTCISYC